jgi:hypothetical protein
MTTTRPGRAVDHDLRRLRDDPRFRAAIEGPERAAGQRAEGAGDVLGASLALAIFLPAAGMGALVLLWLLGRDDLVLLDRTTVVVALLTSGSAAAAALAARSLFVRPPPRAGGAVHRTAARVRSSVRRAPARIDLVLEDGTQGAFRVAEELVERLSPGDLGVATLSDGQLVDFVTLSSPPPPSTG